MSEALVRGIVWPDHGEQRDRAIKLRDIGAVRDENLAFPYFADAEFFERKRCLLAGRVSVFVVSGTPSSEPDLDRADRRAPTVF